MCSQVLARLPYDAAQKAKRGAGLACACWASRATPEILTGHDDGAVLRWAANTPGHMRLLESYSAIPAGCVESAPEDTTRNAVTSVLMILGAAPCIVVRGGNAAELPESLALIRLGGQEGREQLDVTQIPWFGTVQGVGLARPPGSFGVDDAPSAVITLTEGGYLCIFDLTAQAPEPFAPDFQGRPVETAVLEQVCCTPASTRLKLHVGGCWLVVMHLASCAAEPCALVASICCKICCRVSRRTWHVTVS